MVGCTNEAAYTHVYILYIYIYIMYSLVSLFNDISTFVSYLKPKQPSKTRKVIRFNHSFGD